MNNDERVLRLSDLLSILLRNLKSIICITLVFALLGFAYAFYKSQNTGLPLSVQQGKLAEVEERYALSADAYEKVTGDLKYYEEDRLSSLWNQFVLTNDNVSQLANYIVSSPVLSLDPYNCAVSDISVLIRENTNISTDDEGLVLFNTGERASSAISSICTMDTSVLEKTRQILGVETDLYYIQQIISVFNENGVVHIRVYFGDLEAAEEAADYLYSTVADRLRSSDAGFSFEEISRYSGYIVDNNLHDRKLVLSEELAEASLEFDNVEIALFALNTEMESFRNASSLTTDKFNVSRQDLAMAQNAQSHPEAVSGSGRLSVRTIAFAVILGLFIGCFAVICYELFNVKLNSQTEMLNRYSFPLLGLLPSKKKRLFDKTIRRLEGDTSADFETAARAAAQGLLSVSEDRSVCFVSSLGNETASTLVPYLDGKISVCGDILSDPDAVKALSSFDSIVLVEQRGRSNLSLIDSEALRAKALGKEILGIVLL